MVEAQSPCEKGQAASAEQAAVIQSDQKSLVVSASAGSGKTWTIVERYVKHVLEDHIPPQKIICVTYTRKAALEMKNRILRRFEDLGEGQWAQEAELAIIGTIHSLCDRILRENAIEAQIDPRFEILGDEETIRSINEAVHASIDSASGLPGVQKFLSAWSGQSAGRAGGPFSKTARIIRTVLDSFRALSPSLFEEVRPELGCTVTEAYQSASSLREACEQLASHLDLNPAAQNVMPSLWSLETSCGCFHLSMRAWELHESALMKTSKMDFSMLERLAFKLVCGNLAVKDRLAEQYKVLIVDEAQDLNPLQLELIQNLQLDWKLFVGDEKQSIFGFRQAAPQIFQSMLESNSSLPLQHNRRSTPEVLGAIDTALEGQLDGYTALVEESAFDIEQPESPLQPLRQAAIAWRQDQVVELTGEPLLVNLLQEKHQDNVEWKEISVLVRSWDYAKKVQRDLAECGIPCRIAEGNGLLPRMETRDLANALTVLVSHDDVLALLSVLRGPMVELSTNSIAQVALLSDPYTELENLKLEEESEQAKLEECLGWLLPLRHVAYRLNAFEAIDRLIVQAGLLAKIARFERGNESVANVRKLLLMAAQNVEAGPLEFAEYLRTIQKLNASIKDADALDEEDVVNITTIHSAKGLEWNYVVLAQNGFPHGKKSGSDFVIDKSIPFVLTRPRGSPKFKLFDVLEQRQIKGEIDEGKRLLYVALTRAAKGLLLELPGQSNENSFAKWLLPLTRLVQVPPNQNR